MSIFSAISWREQVIFWRVYNDVGFVLDQHDELHFYNASSLKQQSIDIQVASFRHTDMPRDNQSLFLPIIAVHLSEVPIF